MVTQEVMESLVFEDGSSARRESIKLFTYIDFFIVFHIIAMTIFGLTTMKVKTPKARLGEITIQSLNSVFATPSLQSSKPKTGSRTKMKVARERSTRPW